MDVKVRWAISVLKAFLNKIQVCPHLLSILFCLMYIMILFVYDLFSQIDLQSLKDCVLLLTSLKCPMAFDYFIQYIKLTFLTFFTITQVPSPFCQVLFQTNYFHLNAGWFTIIWSRQCKFFFYQNIFFFFFFFFFFCEKKNLTSSKLLDMSSERSGLMTLRVGAGASSSSSLVRDVSTKIRKQCNLHHFI